MEGGTETEKERERESVLHEGLHGREYMLVMLFSTRKLINSRNHAESDRDEAYYLLDHAKRTGRMLRIKTSMATIFREGLVRQGPQRQNTHGQIALVREEKMLDAKT